MATYALKEEDKNNRFSLAIQQMADKIFKSMSYSNTEDLFEAAYNVEKTLTIWLHSRSVLVFSACISSKDSKSCFE
jgi:hypothetical protein